MKNRIYFSSFHPVFLFLFFALELLVTMFCTNPVILLISLAGAVMFNLVTAADTFRGRDFAFYILLTAVIVFTNPLFSHNGVTVLFYIGDIAFTLESLLYGLNVALMLVSVILWCRCFNRVMTDDKTEYLFGRVMPKTSLLITMIFRFIPLYKKQIANIREAQKGIGLYSEGGFRRKLRNAADVFLSLVTWSLENSVDTGLSMKARGYTMLGRTSYAVFSLKVKDFVVLFSFILLASLFLFGVFNGTLQFVFYPALSNIEIDTASVISYISFALISFLPSIIEVKEELTWKYYLSKN